MKKFFAFGLAILMISMITVGIAEVATTTEVTQGFTLDLTSLIEVIGTLVLSVIVYYLAPYLKDKRVQALVKTAYYAAEQLYNTGEIEDKLEYAEEWLKKKGVKVDTRALIEAFCGEVNEYRDRLELSYEARAAYNYGYFDPEDDDEDSDSEEYDDLPDDSQPTTPEFHVVETNKNEDNN